MLRRRMIKKVGSCKYHQLSFLFDRRLNYEETQTSTSLPYTDTQAVPREYPTRTTVLFPRFLSSCSTTQTTARSPRGLGIGRRKGKKRSDYPLPWQRHESIPVVSLLHLCRPRVGNLYGTKALVPRPQISF